MSRRFVSAMCACAGLVTVAGCGGSSGHSTSTADAATICPSVRSAYGRYTEAASAMGLQVENIVLLVNTKKAAEALLHRTEQLERLTTATQRSELAALNGALSDQLKTFVAFENHDLAAAAKYGNSINARLRDGLIHLGTICPPAK